MNQSNRTITSFPANRVAFFDQAFCDYSILLIGKEVSESDVISSLNSFHSQRDAQRITHFFERNSIYSIGLVRSKDANCFQDECHLIEQKIDLEVSHLLVLLEYRSPDVTFKPGDVSAEECFLMSPSEFANSCRDVISTGLAYHLVSKAISKECAVEQIAVHQIAHPNPCFPLKNTVSEGTEVVMPHRGNLNDLRTALWYLEKQRLSPKKVSVCFDEEVATQHFSLIKDYKEANFFVNLPEGVGPYPSRDVLARSTEEEIITFHDSDDCSTIDRIAVLTAKLKDEQLDVVGSHELRVNKISQQLEAIRYPLDVIETRKRENRYGILFPTTAIKKSAYLKVGGLSTIRRHSSDTQFYLKSFFFLNIKNVDEFLYIRIKRENSLTTAPDTALGTPVRERLRQQWGLDFLRMQCLNIDLSLSTLIDEKNVVQIEVVPLEKENIDMILSWQKFRRQIKEKSISKQIKSVMPPDGENMIKDRLLSLKLVKFPRPDNLKSSFFWQTGWAISRVVVILVKWIPAIRKRY